MSDFGSTMRRLREERGLSLTQLSIATNYSKGYLSRLEAGNRAPTEIVARMCDSALEAGGQLLAAFRESEVARAEQAWALEILSTPVATSSHRDDVFRSSVDEYAEQLEAIFISLRSMGHSMSPQLVLPMLLTNIETAGRLLKSARPGDTNKLVLLIARFKEYAGWMAQEAGQIDLAERLTEEFARMVIRAGDQERAQFALIRSADIALYQGDGLKIVELTSKTLSWPGIDLNTRSTALQRQAQGYALLGDRSRCLEALGNARAFHDADQAERGAQALGTTSVPQPVEMARGWALVDLCFYDEAAPVLRREIAAILPHSTRSRVRFTARLALAYAAGGDVDQACETIRTVLTDIHRVDSDTVRVDLKALAEVLRRRWSRNALVGDLLAALKPQLGGSAGLR
jgi:transcriptional regulator with XRE-family HTH domain